MKYKIYIILNFFVYIKIENFDVNDINDNKKFSPSQQNKMSGKQ